MIVSDFADIENIPEFNLPQDRQQRSAYIAYYLKELLMREKARSQSELPSLTTLARYFSCSQMDVYDALRTLKKEGCEYRLEGVDTPVWVDLPADD